jgi:MFS transporter, DHA1 family, inner membrane transport protein
MRWQRHLVSSVQPNHFCSADGYSGTLAPPMPAPDPTARKITYWALLFGNFVIGLGVLMPAGLLNELGHAFSQDPANTGMLIGYGAALLFVEAPLLAFLTNRVDRRSLLTAALAVYAVGHFVSAFAPNFSTLLIARLLMIGGAAAFTPQAASAVSLLAAPERRSTAVAFIFLGWPLASAIGIPLASLMGAYAGWSAAYLVMGVACTVAMIAVFITLPARLLAPRLSVAAWRDVFASRKILLILAVTMIFIAGQFTVYPYLAAELKLRIDAAPALISMLFAVYGISGVIGSFISTRVIGELGAPHTVSIHLAIVLVGLAVWAVGGASLALITIALIAWGYGGGPAISGQQARLIMANSEAASASVALNTSVLYAGQALGTTIGGFLLSVGHATWNGYVGAGLLAVALGASVCVREGSSAASRA